MTAFASCPLCGNPPGERVEEESTWHLSQCTECKLVFCSWHQEKPTDYDNLYGDGGYYEYKYPESARALGGRLVHITYGEVQFLAALGIGRGRTLLDVGCGTGRFMVHARRLGFRPFGVDIAQPAVDFVLRQGLEATCGDIREIAQRHEWRGRFDVVTLFEVIEHVDDPLAFVRATHDLLRPGGSLFLTTPNFQSRWYRATRAYGSRPPLHVTFFGPSTLTRLLDQAGFSQTRIYRKRVVWGETKREPFRRRIRCAFAAFGSTNAVGVTMAAVAKAHVLSTT